MGVSIPHWKGNFGEWTSPLRALGVSDVFSAAEGIMQFSITAWQPTAVLPTYRCHIALSPVKNSWRCGLLSKFFDRVLLCMIVGIETLTWWTWLAAGKTDWHSMQSFIATSKNYHIIYSVGSSLARRAEIRHITNDLILFCLLSVIRTGLVSYAYTHTLFMFS